VKKTFALATVVRSREPRLLLTGQSVSNFGDGVGYVAFSLLILDMTHSVKDLSYFAAIRTLPMVLMLLVGGAITDRFSRRWLLLASDFGRGLITSTVTILAMLGVLHFWELLVYSALFGIFDSVFMPAISAITPEIVGEELLPAMNSAGPLMNSLMNQMIGPAVGGILTAISSTLGIGVDAATFLFSALMLLMMKPTPTPLRAEGTSMISEMRGGLRFFFSTRWMWTTCISVTAMNALVFMPSFALLPFFYRHDLHLSKAAVGVAFGVGGACGALGALTSSNLKIPRRRIRVMWTYWSIATLSGLFIGIATNVETAVLFPIVSLSGIVFGGVIFQTMMQTEVPTEMMGRASSIDWFLSLGLAPVGIVVAGALANSWGVRRYFVIMSLLCALPGLWILISPRINEVDRHRVAGDEVTTPTAS